MCAFDIYQEPPYLWPVGNGQNCHYNYFFYYKKRPNGTKYWGSWYISRGYRKTSRFGKTRAHLVSKLGQMCSFCSVRILVIMYDIKMINYPQYCHSEASGGWGQITELTKKHTLKVINNTLLIAPTAVTSPIMKLGS